MAPSPKEVIIQRLTTLAPVAKTGRIWGRMTGQEFQRIYGKPMPVTTVGAEANAWAGSPDDVAQAVLDALHEAGYQLMRKMDAEDEAKDTW